MKTQQLDIWKYTASHRQLTIITVAALSRFQVVVSDDHRRRENNIFKARDGSKIHKI